jgi:hypothetical protein
MCHYVMWQSISAKEYEVAEKLTLRMFGYYDGKLIPDMDKRTPRKCRVCKVQLQLGDMIYLGSSGNGIHEACYKELPKEIDYITKMSTMSEDELRKQLHGSSPLPSSGRRVIKKSTSL